MKDFIGLFDGVLIVKVIPLYVRVGVDKIELFSSWMRGANSARVRSIEIMPCGFLSCPSTSTASKSISCFLFVDDCWTTITGIVIALRVVPVRKICCFLLYKVPKILHLVLYGEFWAPFCASLSETFFCGASKRSFGVFVFWALLLEHILVSRQESSFRVGTVRLPSAWMWIAQDRYFPQFSLENFLTSAAVLSLMVSACGS